MAIESLNPSRIRVDVAGLRDPSGLLGGEARDMLSEVLTRSFSCNLEIHPTSPYSDFNTPKQCTVDLNVLEIPEGSLKDILDAYLYKTYRKRINDSPDTPVWEFIVHVEDGTSGKNLSDIHFKRAHLIDYDAINSHNESIMNNMNFMEPQALIPIQYTIKFFGEVTITRYPS